MSTEPEADRLLTDVDIARRLKCSADKVRRRSRAGDFPVIRIGRDYRYTEDDYEAILATHRREAKEAKERGVTKDNPFGIITRGKKKAS